MSLLTHHFTFNPFSENTYVLFDETKECIIVDPGCCERDEIDELEQFIGRHQLMVKSILNTHCHIDHVLGNYPLKETYKVPLLLHQREVPLLKAVITYASNYGFPDYTEAEADGYLDESSLVKFGNQQLKVLFVPGHSPGHIAFHDAPAKTLIGGDVLFQESIGRTDLPGGNYDQLLKSIHEKFFTLPDDTVVFAGHGPPTTIGHEKVSNPFCRIIP